MSDPIILNDEAATRALGAWLAPQLRAGDIVALSGGLGVGKTTLTRALLEALGLAGEAPSPTFAIVHMYEEGEVRLPVAHADLYRLDGPQDVVELGLDEWLDHGALIAEWPDRLPEAWQHEALWLELVETRDGARELTARVPPAWKDRWSTR